MNEPLHRNPYVIEEGNRLIASLREKIPSLMYTSVATDDGFEVVSFNRLHIRDLGEDSRVSSMVSSLQGLSEAIAVNLALGEIEHSAITTESGHFIAQRVPGLTLIICGVFDRYEELSNVLMITASEAKIMAINLTT